MSKPKRRITDVGSTPTDSTMIGLVAKVREKFEARGGLPDLETGVREIEEALATGAKDEAGFLEGTIPHITEEQFVWLSYRLGLDTDEQACLVSGIEEVVVAGWMTRPEFVAVMRASLANKREGFKLLITHLNPKGLRVISEMLDSESSLDRRAGLNALLRAQGLLIDQHKKIDADAISTLIAQLRAPGETRVAKIGDRVVEE